MEERELYSQIARRTDGNIYLCVVGPVRTGKSTFIKRFMEELVIPNIENVYRRERARDELPQSSSGRTIMTAEPKFVPEEAVEISPDGASRIRVRLIDSVGYMVAGAVGATEDGTPRMVTTPWAPEPIPLTQAAELGTKKVMEDHGTIGVVITTDGTVTDIPRADYAQAEERSIRDMQATGKPFVVLVNSADPAGEAAKSLCAALEEQYGVQALAVDCLQLGTPQIQSILTGLLMSFPLRELRVFLPRWLDALEPAHPLKKELFGALAEQCGAARLMRDAEAALAGLSRLDCISDWAITDMDLGKGMVTCRLSSPEDLFYQVLSQQSGFAIPGDDALLVLLRQLAEVKREYDKVSAALEQVRATGYGVVTPRAEEMSLQPPEITRRGGTYGVKMKAAAPSIHMLRADIETEVSPMVGDEQQARTLLEYLAGQYQEDPEQLWQSNIFGRTVFQLVTEGLDTKLHRMPDDARYKLRDTLQRILNEGSGGLICILL